MTRLLGNGESLFDIYLARIPKLLDSGAFCGGAIALSVEDEGLYVLAKKAGVPIIERSQASIEKGAPLCTIFGFLRDVPADMVMWVNGCQPFLRNTTIVNAANRSAMNQCTATSVVKSKEIFWVNGMPIDVENAQQHRSDGHQEMFRSSHSFHIFSRLYMLSMSRYWTCSFNDPGLFEIQDERETLDADTVLDFNILSSLWNGDHQ